MCNYIIECLILSVSIGGKLNLQAMAPEEIEVINVSLIPVINVSPSGINHIMLSDCFSHALKYNFSTQ